LPNLCTLFLFDFLQIFPLLEIFFFEIHSLSWSASGFFVLVATIAAGRNIVATVALAVLSLTETAKAQKARTEPEKSEKIVVASRAKSCTMKVKTI